MENEAKVLVALSGGADSCTLLVLLKSIEKQYNISISAIHINHKIRQGEADRDQAFSRNLCKKLGVEFFEENVNIPEIAKSKNQSIELCAREQRYEIFKRVARQNNFNYVALAHTASDNAETIIFNLCRGSSLKGLCGIPPKRLLCDNISIIRPLIEFSRADVEKVLSIINQDYVTDSSNFSDDYTRNNIRHNIIPLLKEINPSLETTLLSTSNLLRSDSEFLESYANENTCLELSKLLKLDKSILTRVLRNLYNKTYGQSLEYVHVKAIASQIEKSKGALSFYSRISLPQKTSALIENGKLKFENDDNVYNKIEFSFPLEQGVNFIPGTHFALFCDFSGKDPGKDKLQNNKNVYKKYNTVYIYTDKLNSELFVSPRNDGDVFFYRGMHRRVKSLFNKSGLSVRFRNLLPFVKVGDEIVYIPMIGIGDNFSKPDANKKTVCLSFYICNLLEE